MQNIKIPLLIKIYAFFIFVLTTFNIIFLDFVYAFHGFGKYFWIFTGIAFLWILYSFSIYRYIKSPSKWNGRLHSFISFILFIISILNVIGYFIIYLPNTYNSIFIVDKVELYTIGFLVAFLLIISFFTFLRFIKINRLLKKENIENKFYSEKTETKGLLISFLIFILSLIVFYFTYYTTPPIEFKKIPDSYFDDSKLYRNVDSNENGYKVLEKYRYGKNFVYNKNFKETTEKRTPYEGHYGKEYKKDLDTIKSIKETEEYKKFKEKYRKFISNFMSQEYDKIKNITFNKKQILINDLERKERKLIFNSNIYIEPFREYYSYLTRGLTQTTKNTIYNVLFYLKNKNEKKAIQYLVEDYKFGKLLISGYTDLVQKIIGLTSTTITGIQINYILDNYKLKKESLEYLKDNIKNSKNIDGTFDKAMIYEYHNMVDPLKKINLSKGFVEDKINGGNNFIQNINKDFFNVDINLLKLNTIFFDGNNLKDIEKNIYYYAGKNDIDKKLKFCRKKGLSRTEIYKFLYLKKNGYFIINGIKNCISFKGYEEEFQNIQKQEKEIIEKIDKQLKEIEEKEKKQQKINIKVLEFFRK